MPSLETFTIKPITELLNKYISPTMKVIDPFARNSKWGTITNDINPETSAQYHMDAVEFLDMLINKKIQVDIILFDPPYSPRQISECYKKIGKKIKMQDTQNAHLNKLCKDKFSKLLKGNGIVISFAWNTSGMGKKRGFQIIEILLIAHGGSHNDTIITVEKKIST